MMLIPFRVTTNLSKARVPAGAMSATAKGMPVPPPGYIVKAKRIGTFTFWVFYRKIF